METPNSLRIMSVFFSISGEINAWPQGTPTVFIRLAGCNLTCKFCDTPQSRPAEAGEEMTFSEILFKIKSFGFTDFSRVKFLITGGEPLTQAPGVDALILNLRRAYSFCEIAIETNGSFLIDCLKNQPDCWVIDVKPKSLGMDIFMVPVDTQIESTKIPSHILKGRPSTIIFKWLACSLPDDILPLAFYLLKKGQQEGVTHAVSPFAPVKPAELWENMRIFRNHPVALNCQIHKLLEFE